VNTHFLARFSGAFLQTVLQTGVNIGTALAARGTNSAVVLALPGSFQTTTTSATTPSNDIKPTLTVAPGTSISVLVARDLDFTDVEGRP
jgi:type IV secretion system protein VirB10